MKYNEFFNIYPKRDPICVSHYPSPVDEIKPSEVIKYAGLEKMPKEHNVGAVYVHVPFCEKICVFCPFNKVSFQQEEVNQYVESVKNEMKIYGSTNYIKNTDIDSIYFGGGTPSSLSAEQLVDLLNNVFKNYNVLPGAQVSFEGSPSTLNLEKLKAIKQAGANRLSIGVQTFNEKSAKYLKLNNTPAQAEKVIKEAFASGFENVGIDLMYNLPDQTIGEWLADVRKAIDLNVKNITVFSMCVVPFTRFFNMIKNKEVPPIGDIEDEIIMYLEAKKMLEDAGYVQYSVWDFAKPEFIDKHVILYYSKQKDLISHGPAAFGYVNRLMYINEGNVQAYLERLKDNKLSIHLGKKADEIEAMHGMMAKGLRMISVNRNDFQDLFGCQPEKYFKDKIDTLVNEGLLELNENEIKLSHKGIVWGNNVCKEFFSENNKQSFEERVSLVKGKKPEKSSKEAE